MVKLGKDTAGGAKSRAIIFFFTIVIIVAVLIGYLWYKRHQQMVPTVAGLAGAPGIESIPGGGKATTEYVKIQEAQNIKQAEEAAKRGTAAVPTITRVSYFGPGEFQGAPTKPGCSPEELRRARLAGVTADELRCKGCSLAELKAAGYTAGELANAGFTPTDLKNAGFTPADLRQAGFTAGELKKAGFSPQDLAAAGYNPNELSQAGFSPNDLQRAGISPATLAAAGIGAKPANLPKDCSIDALKKARAQGVPAAALRKMGCGAAALRAAGYTAADLKAGGFTPEELKAAGFSPKELRDAGFTAGQLRRAGFNANDLKNAGFTPSDLRNAGFGAGDLKNAGFSPDDLKKAGYSNGDLLRAGYSPEVVAPTVAPPAAPANCSVQALQQARAQGIPASELKKRCSAAALLAAGFTPAELKAAGFSDDDLRNAGLNPAQIAAANAQLANQCSVEALRQARAQGVPVSELRKRGCSGAALRAAGYPAGDLKGAGYSDDDLRNAGYSPDEIAATAGISGAAVVPPVGTSELQLSQLQAKQEQQLNQQQKQERLGQIQTSMLSQANSLFGTWTPPAPQQYVEGEAPKKEEVAGATTAMVVPPTTTATTTVAAAKAAAGGVSEVECADVKAGEVMMAVITSSIDSDENSPVMATIVSGKLKGGKLIGQFTLLKQKVLVNFNKLDLPGKPASIGINAVAIDPDTAHTALASCVNNHYWLRYGTLFASSFLSGLADAISQQGSQVSTGAGGILVTHDPLSVGQQVAVALGAVGSQYASVLGSNFTRPPTVYVYDGSSIGILFLQDLTLPTQCCPEVNRLCGAAEPCGTCVTHY